MNPIYLILYAAFVTLVITLVFARQRPLSPTARRWLWVLLAVGLLVFFILFYVGFLR